MPTTSAQSVRRGRRPSTAMVRTQTSVTSSRRIASNFAFLSLAEVACRSVSVVVTLLLTQRLGRGGFGRIEFGFNVVFWLVLIVRDGFEVIAARETARHPRLLRPLVNHILGVKIALASVLYAALWLASSLAIGEAEERGVLRVYGLLLFTTAFGLDFAYRGIERMGLVAVSLVIRTIVYALGIVLLVQTGTELIRIPQCLVCGEAIGIAIVWVCYASRFGVPRPSLGSRFLRVILRRGQPILMIHLAQTVLTTIDLMVVGFLAPWNDGGLYSAPQRLIAAVVTFGLIFQQVVFPTLSRGWRLDAEASRRSLDRCVALFAPAFVPIAVGATILSGSIVAFLYPADYAGASTLLAIGIWRAPLLAIAFLYQGALIAFNREAVASRVFFLFAGLSPIAVAVGLTAAGLPGASGAMVLVALGLCVTTYIQLRTDGRAPVWHHHLAKPLLASVLMAAAAIPLARIHVLAGVFGGGLVYLVALHLFGASPLDEMRSLVCCKASPDRNPA